MENASYKDIVAGRERDSVSIAELQRTGIRFLSAGPASATLARRWENVSRLLDIREEEEGGSQPAIELIAPRFSPKYPHNHLFLLDSTGHREEHWPAVWSPFNGIHPLLSLNIIYNTNILFRVFLQLASFFYSFFLYELNINDARWLLKLNRQCIAWHCCCCHCNLICG